MAMAMLESNRNRVVGQEVPIVIVRILVLIIEILPVDRCDVYFLLYNVYMNANDCVPALYWLSFII